MRWPNSMRFALFALELLVLFSPQEFRRTYRAAIRTDFIDIITEEFAQHGSLGAFRYACRAYTDLLISGLQERAAMIVRDLIYSVRSLRKTPVFTAVVITTLALAISANAAVFSVVNGVLLKPLPFNDPASLVAIYGDKNPESFSTMSYPNFADLRAQNHSFTDMAAATRDAATLAGHGPPHALLGQSVSFSYFSVSGVRPLIGRFFSARDSRLGSAHAIVLSNHVFEAIFGADRAVIGTSVALDGEPYTIVGVAPATFRAPTPNRLFDADYWTVIRPSHATGEDQRGAQLFAVYARLRPGVSQASAQADVALVVANLAHRYVSDDKHFSASVVSLGETILGPVRPLLFGVFAAVAGVLLVACANVANLLLSRAATRERELAVRYAIGASRARIIAQILTETLLFATIGGILGIALAAGALHQFVALSPRGIPRLDTITLDTSAALFTFTIVVFSTLAAGLVPALTLSRVQLGDALKAAGRGGDRSRGARARAAFVVGEIAITLALITVSGLVIRSFIALTSTPLGFDPAGVTAINVASLSPQRYRTEAQLMQFERRAVEREAALPGVTDAAWADIEPFTGTYRISFTLPQRPLPPGDENEASFNIVSSDYFGALRIPLVRGRLFSDDDRVGSSPVIIVNETFARRFYGKRSAIGQRITPQLTVTNDERPRIRTIVGVAADTRDRYSQLPEPQIYFPNSQVGFSPSGTILVRSRSTIDHSILSAALTSLDPDVAPATIRAISADLAADSARARLSAVVLGTLGTIALFLAVAGIYAVVSYGVAQRTHEFGIRKALGARGSHVLYDVLVRAARLAALGVCCGLILAAFASRLVAGQLYGVAPADPLTYAAVVVTLFAAAFIAALIPALRAMRVDPIVALRYE